MEEFTEEKKELLLGKRQGRGADFVRAVQEIVDCYDKLKENNRVDNLSSGDPVPEKAVTGDVSATNATDPDAIHNSTVKSSNSSRPKDEPGTAIEDVGALTEVESLRKRGPSEELDNNAVAPSLSIPNTYTLRKKSRSSQPQRSANKKKTSVQRSRSSLRFHPCGLQNGDLKSNDSKHSDEVGLNGFLDGPLRRAKRSKRSPDLIAPSVGDSPVCHSNGTIEDDGSEIAMADSENLSNNECSAIESNHKRESGIFSGNSEGLELCRRLDFPAKTAVVRKKRNPGRKRAQNDGLESTSRSDQEVSNEIRGLKDALILPALSANLIDSHPKDEGDEHLPLVKRARVRMGKLLAEEHQTLDFLVKSEEKQTLDFLVKSEENQMHDFHVKSEEKSLDSVCASGYRLPTTPLNCDDIHPPRNLLTVNELMVASPVNTINQIQEDKPQPQKNDSCAVNEPVVCSPVENPGDKTQPWNSKINPPSGCVFDGEAALPPSKRLHRALEAMSANAAEESQTPLEVSLSTEVEMEESHLTFRNANSDMLVKNVAVNNLESHDGSLNCNNALLDDCSGLLKISNSSSCEVITKSFQEVSMLDSPDRNLESEKAEFKDNAEEAVVRTDNKDLSGSESTKAPDNDVLDQASQVFLSSVTESGPLLQSPTIQPPLMVLNKVGDEAMHESGIECNKSEDSLHSVRDRDVECNKSDDSLQFEEKAVDVECSNGTSANLCNEEARNFAANENLEALMDQHTEASSM